MKTSQPSNSRVRPYIAPRRQLHVDESATFVGRRVRHTNPACSQPAYIDGSNIETCNEYKGPVRGVAALRAFDTTVATCAKLACDTGRSIQKTDLVVVPGSVYGYKVNDTRCFVALPPEQKTHNVLGNNYDANYEGLNDTFAYSVVDLFQPPVAGVIADIDIARCLAGTTNATIARQIQEEAGLIAPSTVAVSATTSLLATATAAMMPTPTAAIATTAPLSTITALGIGFGVLGSGLVISGAVFAGYKLVQHCQTKTKINPGNELTEINKYTRT